MPLYPLLVLEVGSGPQVPTFRNSTCLDLQVGLARDLGARHPWCALYGTLNEFNTICMYIKVAHFLNKQKSIL
jgi:hypothetical protein